MNVLLDHDAQREKSHTEGNTGCEPTEGKPPEQVDPQIQSWFLVFRGRGREGMITKRVRDIFGVREMFQNRAVLTVAQLSKVSPRATVQPVRTSLSG